MLPALAPPQTPLQAASLERLEGGAAASAAEAARLRGELSAQAEAQEECRQAEGALAQRLKAVEAQLREAQGAHRQLQAAHGALQAAHQEQGSKLRARLQAAQQRLRDSLAAQEELEAAAERARQAQQQQAGDAVQQRALVAMLRDQLQQAEQAAATYKGRYHAVQAANDSLKVQLLGAGASISGSGSGSGSKAPHPPAAVAPALPPSGPAISPRCPISAAATVAAGAKAAALTPPPGRCGSPVGDRIPAAGGAMAVSVTVTHRAVTPDG